METHRSKRVPRFVVTTGGLLMLGAAVLGGRAWGEGSTPSHAGVALAAGSVTSGNWVTQVAQSARNSVVSISVSSGRASGSRFGGGGSAGTGTGMLLDTRGNILTNNHVVTLDSTTSSATIQVSLANGKSDAATLVGQDVASDLAVIRVPAADVAGLTPITWADPASVQVGEPVVAIGYALDLGGEPTVTSGVLSAINREIDEQSATISGAVQTDAAVNPGNSGGPLLDQDGHVIGVNTAGLVGTAQQPAQGINFAVSGQTAESVAKAIIDHGSVTRGYIGVSVTNVTPQDATSNGSPAIAGAGIQQVSAGSPAAAAGLKAGDIITKVQDVTIASTGDLTTALTRYAPGTTVTVTFYRGSAQQTAQLTLGQHPAG
jgi:putative serine protease PepD